MPKTKNQNNISEVANQEQVSGEAKRKNRGGYAHPVSRKQPDAGEDMPADLIPKAAVSSVREDAPASCAACKGLGYLTEKGIVHTCWDCLESGRLG